MRNLLYRFLDTRKLAALILVAAIAAAGVAMLTAPARAGHDADTATVIRPVFICRTPDAVAGVFTAGAGRLEYWSTQVVAKVCFQTAGRVSVRVHGVVGEGVWLGDGLDDQMVILEVFDRIDQVGYTWTIKTAWEARQRVKPSGFSV